MEYIFKYRLFLENYSEIKNKIDEILDKISSHGIDSLTKAEKRLLDSQKEGGRESKEAYYDLIDKDIIDKEFESDNGRFKFILKSIETEYNIHKGVITHLKGIMKLPDIITGDGDLIEGDLEGYVSIDEKGLVHTSFEKDGYYDFDFVEGLEHEYDNFVYEIPNNILNIK